jgi:hypothetical protein
MNIPVENAFNPIMSLKKIEGENFDDCIGTINYGDGLDFKYINFQNINLTKSIVTPQEIFNLNIFLVISKLSDYFSNTNINLAYEKSNRNELILKDSNFAIKHNIYISFKQDDKYFDCGIDFVNKSSYIDQYQYISSIVNLDYYRYFDENIDTIDTFMEDCICRLLIIMCSLNNDEFKLAEILFIKSNKNLSDLKEQLEIYKKIIYGKKNNFVNFSEFYEELMPVDPDTGADMEYEEFIKYIQDNIFNGEKLNFSNDNLLYWDDFDLVLLCLDKNISKIIINYKKIYIQAMNTLNTALKTIIELVQQINKTKKYIPQYIIQLLSVDIINFADKELLNDIHEKLSDYFDEQLN